MRRSAVSPCVLFTILIGISLTFLSFAIYMMIKISTFWIVCYTTFLTLLTFGLNRFRGWGVCLLLGVIINIAMFFWNVKNAKDVQIFQYTYFTLMVLGLDFAIYFVISREEQSPLNQSLISLAYADEKEKSLSPSVFLQS